jgi:hypothetical protein
MSFADVMTAFHVFLVLGAAAIIGFVMIYIVLRRERRLRHTYRIKRG